MHMIPMASVSLGVLLPLFGLINVSDFVANSFESLQSVRCIDGLVIGRPSADQQVLRGLGYSSMRVEPCAFCAIVSMHVKVF